MRVRGTDGSTVPQLLRHGYISTGSWEFKNDKALARYILRRMNIKVVVDEETGCWHWPLAVSVGVHMQGYGKVRWDNKVQGAHRWLLQQMMGRAIPRRLQVDHAKWAGCEYRDCVNPDHLEIVSRAENMRRSDVSRYRHFGAWCEEGHPFKNANTFFKYDSESGYMLRYCVTCNPHLRKFKAVQDKKTAAFQIGQRSHYRKAA